ncbi:MAG: prepilin-type N-terminal cleavage/methylation domain-containing protein, partial [Candidatus Curtissbacteria bacterium]|nr:prepilin-type N-terminal cleavage/methylation domain-containing protein [Candidatus Curtissbacteria bacterium]
MPSFKLKIESGKLKIKTLNSQLSNLKSRGFTLIELMVVVTIISILTATGIASFTTAQSKSRDHKRKQDLAALRTALLSYYTDQNVYPGTASATYTSDSGPNWIPNISPNYIKKLPEDPSQAGLITELATNLSPLASLFGKDNPQVAAAPPPERTALLNERVGFG